jgi:hypothetical protein
MYDDFSIYWNVEIQTGKNACNYLDVRFRTAPGRTAAGGITISTVNFYNGDKYGIVSE